MPNEINNNSQDLRQWSVKKIEADKTAGRLTVSQQATYQELITDIAKRFHQMKIAMDHKSGEIQSMAERLGVHGFNLRDPQDWARLEAVVRKHIGLNRGELMELMTNNELPGYLAAAIEQAMVEAPGKRKSKAKHFRTTRPLTTAQSQALTIYFRCNSVAIVAEVLGISRSAAYDRVKAAMEKTGQNPERATRSVRAKALPTDSRGQPTIADD